MKLHVDWENCKVFQMSEFVTIPTFIVNKNSLLKIDVIENDIPSLFNKDSSEES